MDRCRTTKLVFCMSELGATSVYIAAIDIQLEVGVSKTYSVCVAKGIKLCLWGKDS